MNVSEGKKVSSQNIERLLAVMHKLRDKDKGCSWDLQQTLKTLTAYTLEEVYEVIDAIDRDDPVQLCDELGDLLFQVVFYAQIAAEEGHFTFHEVVDAITEKLLRRHPHVFPDGTLESFGAKTEITAEQVAVNWELIKNQERKKTAAESVLDDVPLALPALERARKLQKRAASLGFDWPEKSQVVSKLDEEIGELKQALTTNNNSAISHELGDVLFTCVNLARHLQIEPELILREANQRFEQRFRHVEKQAATHGQSIETMRMKELNLLWQNAKSILNG
ncbi:MAG: nucleoside triphosphate pyrophosphohydrolase [Pseudomonadales bacterium]|nr:nucleoside triphosphate pyrophosphohydrolase [Pseudomonadales bacterium]